MLTMDIHLWLDFRKTLKQQSNIHHENTTDWKAEEPAELWWVCCFAAADEFVLILYNLLNVPLLKMFLTFLSGWSEACATYIMAKGSSRHHVWRWAPESVEPLTCVRSATWTAVCVGPPTSSSNFMLFTISSIWHIIVSIVLYYDVLEPQRRDEVRRWSNKQYFHIWCADFVKFKFKAFWV